MDPPPVETLMMRGVPPDLERRGSKASTVAQAPAALVRKHSISCWNMVPLANAIPALLTRASRLGGLSDGLQMCCSTYCPCSASTFFAAAVIDSSSATSIRMSSTEPGSLRDCSSLTAASPFSMVRLPRRTCLDASASSWAASSKPIPLFAVQTFSMELY